MFLHDTLQGNNFRSLARWHVCMQLVLINNHELRLIEGYINIL